MKNKPFRLFSLLMASLLFSAVLLTGQNDEAIKKTKEELKATFGQIPTMYQVFPDNALPGAWEAFKNLTGPDAAIPNKYQELIGLAVSAQIPCQYCIYYHTELAKAYGATEAEIKEAVAYGALVRHWSTVLQGNQLDFEEFKGEMKEIMDYMAKQTGKD